MSDAPLVYTIEEAAQLLRIGRTTAYDAARRGELPSVRLGRRLLVPRQALEHLMKAGQGDGGNGRRAKPDTAHRSAV
jgi:excisionase family DNA binding protein